MFLSEDGVDRFLAAPGHNELVSFPAGLIEQDKGTVLLSPGIARLVSQANPSSNAHPEGIHFPSGILIGNILTAANAYVIESSKVA